MEATLDERTLKRIEEIYDEYFFQLFKGSCNKLRRILTNFERIDETKIQFNSEILYLNELIYEDRDRLFEIYAYSGPKLPPIPVNAATH